MGARARVPSCECDRSLRAGSTRLCICTAARIATARSRDRRQRTGGAFTAPTDTSYTARAVFSSSVGALSVGVPTHHCEPLAVRIGGERKGSERAEVDEETGLRQLPRLSGSSWNFGGDRGGLTVRR
jgi:hypothetical protein